MIARIWRGWAAADDADEIADHLREGPLARFVSAPGNVSAEVMLRPQAGGVEVMTFSVWESPDVVPSGVEERHPLLVARQTVAARWEIVGGTMLAVRAA
jgi:heme-degrading monooxygenase HmoA